MLLPDLLREPEGVMSKHNTPQLLPPDHPDAPKYWMYESSGVLRPVVEAYLHGEVLNRHQIGILRAYLAQWVQAPVWGSSRRLDSLRFNVWTIKTQNDIRAALETAVDLGMDPL